MMDNPWTAYVSSPDQEGLGETLARGGFDWIGGSAEGEKAYREILALTPEFLLLDGALYGMDGLEMLGMLSANAPCPPRVLYLSRGRGEGWLALALQKGADAALRADAAINEILSSAREAAARPLPRLARPWEDTRREIADGLLNDLGVSQSLKGRRYMLRAAEALACAPALGRSYSRRLYPFLASEFAASPGAVERAVRTAVEDTWLHGNLAAIQKLFGLSVDADRGKPTNAEFLAMMAEHVRRETRRRMLSSGA